MPIRQWRNGMASAADSVAKGTLTNLGTRLLGVAAVLAITTLTARLGTEVQGAFALFTGVEGLLLALFSGFGIALARRVSHHGESPRALTTGVRRCGCWRSPRLACCWRRTWPGCGSAKAGWARWRC